MFTRPKALVFASTLFFNLFVSGQSIAANQYPSFNLQNNKLAEKPYISFTSPRVSLKGKKSSFKVPRIDATEYVGVKEEFLAEKREEAIKILRQQIDSGLAKDRESLLLRLGQLYAEKYMEFSHRENEIFSSQLAENAKKGSGNEPKLDNSRSQRYLKDALTVFNTMEREFPNHPRIDEVDFFIGFVELEQGNEKRGVRYLERVVQRYPQSRKFDEALVFLGDHYYEKRKVNEAIVRYNALGNRKSSPLFYYARYKMAWCELNQNRARTGLDILKKLVFDLANTQEASKFNLRNQVLKDIVAFFAEVEAVDEATNFYQAQVGKEAAAEGIKLIADMLKAKGRDESSIRAYLKVLEYFGDTLEAPKAEIAIFESYLRLAKMDRAVTRFIGVIEKYRPGSSWEEQFNDNPAAIKSVMTELQSQAEKAALFFHQSAQKTNNKTSYRYALSLYDAILKFYPEHPSLKKLTFYRAEVLFVQGKYLEASQAYADTSRMPPRDKLSDEAIYNALLCLDKMMASVDTIARLTKEEQKTADLTPEDIPLQESRFLEIAALYLKDYPQGERVVDVQFRIGAIYYRHKHYDEALNILKGIALKYPNHRTATTAAHLVLDIHNLQKDYQKLNSVAAEFASIKTLGDAQFKEEVGEIVVQNSFKDIEHYERQNLWSEAAAAYLDFYNKNSQGKLADDALYNALVSFEKLTDIDKISETARLYMAKFPAGKHARRVTLVAARLAEKTFDIEGAQKIYAHFYTKFPKDSEASKALYNAAVFAELLEKNIVALSLYEDYLKLGNHGQDEILSIQISLAKIHRKMGKWDKVNSIYRRLAKEAKTPEERLAFLGELARQYLVAGKVDERVLLLREIVDFYDGNRRLRSGPGVQYVAEAKFHDVRKLKDKFDQIKLRFPPEDLIYLLRKKQRLLTQLVKAYDNVIAVGVPEWGVAALYEKSAAYANFVSMYRDVKVPSRYKGEEKNDAEKALSDIDIQLVKPLEAKISEFLKLCAERAGQFHVLSEFAAKCNDKTSGVEAVNRPAGLIPRPNYWSTRWPGEEGVARR